MSEKRYTCGCGRILGSGPCEGGPFAADAMVVVQRMPEYLRSTHIAAGHTMSESSYPDDGSERIAVDAGNCLDFVQQPDDADGNEDPWCIALWDEPVEDYAEVAPPDGAGGEEVRSCRRK